jgi:hypothetical protein
MLEPYETEVRAWLEADSTLSASICAGAANEHRSEAIHEERLTDGANGDESLP